MATPTSARSHAGGDHSDDDDHDDHPRSPSPSIYSTATDSDAGDGTADNDTPCESAFDRVPDEIIQQ